MVPASNLASRLADHEEIMRVLDHKSQKNQAEIEFLSKKSQLSPDSKRRKLYLEKREVKVRKELEKKKRNYIKINNIMDQLDMDKKVIENQIFQGGRRSFNHHD
jgi:uncharacterized protein (DUF342 family)